MANPNQREVYFVDGTRSPFLKARGRPGPLKAAELGVLSAKPLIQRLPVDPDLIDQVIVGNTAAGPTEQNIARVISVRLGLGEHIPAWTVHRNCASGLQSLDCAARAIANGESDLILAGGVEVMSHAPLLWQLPLVHWLADWGQSKSPLAKLKTLSKLKLKHLAPEIALLGGLSDQTCGMSMGQTAEKVAKRFSIDRQAMDEYSVTSHLRLHAAQEENRFDEIAPIFGPDGESYAADDGVRPNSSVEKLAKLRPVFDPKFGNVTAGNSAQITDGAAWMILASADAVKKHNLPVIGKAVATQWSGLDPTEMGLGPAHAIPELLNDQGLGIDDIDYWELNEAFAGQVLACLRALEDDSYCQEKLGLDKAFGSIPLETLNVDGGGISLGHPVGATGTRITLHLLDVLKRNNKKRGVATLCIGGGQGGAMLIEQTESVA